MAVHERRRSELFQAAAQALGQEHAVTMFELLPPPETDLATQQSMDLRFDAVDQRFEAMDQRFDAVDQRFTDLERRFDQRLDDGLGRLREELLAAFRGELVTAVAGQARAVMLAVVTTTVAIGVMALTFA